MIQRRLTFETLSPFVAADIEYRRGRTVWPSMDFSALWPWYKSVVEFTGDDRMDQYRTLKSWAETRQQPIRNVKLEEREIPDTDDGWREV